MTASLRPYTASDRPACLALFDSNVPAFFAVHERAEFADHLDQMAPEPAPFLVVAFQGQPIACGGLSLQGDGAASLSWGMVGRDWQGRGMGTLLTKARLDLARSSGITRLTLATSQHTAAFYARFGFVVEAITPDGFAPGLDRVDMALDL